MYFSICLSIGFQRQFCYQNDLQTMFELKFVSSVNILQTSVLIHIKCVLMKLLVCLTEIITWKNTFIIPV